MKSVIIVRSNPISYDPRVKKEAKSLSNNGFNVSILGRDKEDKYKKYEEIDNYKIYRFNYKIGKYSLATFKTIFLPFSLFIWWIYELFFLFRNEWDIVHSCDLDTLFPAILAAKIKRKKLIYDIFDVYGSMIDTSSIPQYILDLTCLLECIMLKFADATILVSESQKKQLRNAKFSKNTIIIMNTHRDFRKEVKKDSKEFIIFFGGLISKRRGLIQVIEALKKIDNARLIVAGYGYDEKELIPIFEENQIEFLGKISHEKILELTKKADLLFILCDTAISNCKYAFPNKLFEAMLCGKPILVNENTFMANIIKEEECGIIVPYNNISKIREAILNIKNNPELGRKLGYNGRRAYEQKYNWDIMEKRLLSLYETLI